MLIFRSEDHLDRWLGDRPPGTVMAIDTLAELANAWWGDRLAADWCPRTRLESQAILEGLGLVGPFWNLG
jgi:hypothetical protein